MFAISSCCHSGSASYEYTKDEKGGRGTGTAVSAARADFSQFLYKLNSHHKRRGDDITSLI
jgi:hypothetical protein